MNKILIGLLFGLVLGAVDGATAWFTPEARPMIAGIMVGSSIKGMVVGILSGWFARKVQSTMWGVVVGAALGLLFAFAVASMGAENGKHYYLEIMLPDPQAVFAKVRHAGAAFLGAWCPEALGDYVAGPNHVLPTGRTARFASGLSVFDFLKRTTWLAAEPAGLAAPRVCSNGCAILRRNAAWSQPPAPRSMARITTGRSPKLPRRCRSRPMAITS